MTTPTKAILRRFGLAEYKINGVLLKHCEWVTLIHERNRLWNKKGKRADRAYLQAKLKAVDDEIQDRNEHRANY